MGLTRPVSISQIRSALGAASSVNKLSQLCTYASVNKYSKYKPIKYAANSIMSQYDYTNERWKDDSTWWKGSNGKCGFTPYSTNTIGNVITNTTGGMNGWTYDGVPTGGTYPYRQADFIGYNHNAVPFISNFACLPEIKANGVFQASCMIPTDADNVTLGDIGINGSALYFGVIITNSSGSRITQVTNSVAGEVGVSFQFPASIGLGSYRCYPFLSTNPISLGGDVGNNTYYTCPNVSYATFNVVQSYQNLDVDYDASYELNSHTKIDVTLKNNESTNIANCYVYIIPFTTQNWSNPASAISQAVGSSGPFTLISGFSTLKRFTVTQGNYFAYITLNNNAESRKTNIREDIDPDA